MPQIKINTNYDLLYNPRSVGREAAWEFRDKVDFVGRTVSTTRKVRSFLNMFLDSGSGGSNPNALDKVFAGGRLVAGVSLYYGCNDLHQSVKGLYQAIEQRKVNNIVSKAWETIQNVAGVADSSSEIVLALKGLGWVAVNTPWSMPLALVLLLGSSTKSQPATIHTGELTPSL